MIEDYFVHFLAGAVLAFILDFFISRPNILLLVFLLGLSKEIIDQINYSGFDFIDLTSTICGCFILKIMDK